MTDNIKASASLIIHEWSKLRIDTRNNYLVRNGKLSHVEVDRGKHVGEWLMNSLCL